MSRLEKEQRRKRVKLFGEGEYFASGEKRDANMEKEENIW